MDDIQTMQAGGVYERDRRGVRAIELGPYPFPVRADVHGYSVHTGGGDHSTASMTLYYDGNAVASASDSSFNTADLKTDYAVVFDGGNIASYRIETTNSGANESHFGIKYRLSRA